MSAEWLVPSLVAAFAAILAFREYFAYKGNLRGKYLLTPLITLCVTAMVIVSMEFWGIAAYRVLVLMSLMCALIADTMLMVVEVDLLKYGIVYFLVGHLFYIAAFSTGYYFLPWNLLIAAVIIAAVALFFYRIRGKTKGLAAPVAAYLVIISVMVFLAVSGLNDWPERNRVFAAAGAVLFMLSDMVLATNAFLKKIPHSTVITWAFYAPAQMLIALSCFG